MNYETYAPVLEKAKAVLTKKEIKGADISFSQVRVPVLTVKVFRYISKAKRKLIRRFAK